ncbi:MAG: TraI/MobA(P) family conjugative relaxase [Polyangiales bacterium]
MIVRHQRASRSNNGFRQLARYIQGRSTKPRATWFLAANLPGVTRPEDLELACRLVEAANAQNTRAGSDRTYHLVISLHPEDRSLDAKELRRVVENLVETLGFSGHQYIAARHNDKDHEHVHVAINKIHPETFRIHSPAWDHQKLFTAGRVLELELGLTPLQSRARDREKVPQRAADHEAHHGIDSFARWARKRLGPALQGRKLRSWNEVHEVCASLGVVLQPHGNGLVFEDVEQCVRVKASFVDRQLSKPRLCQRFGEFRPAHVHQLEAARTATRRYSPVPAIAPLSLWKEYEQSLGQARLEREHSWTRYRRAAASERQRLKGKYRHQRALIAALPISGADKKRLSQQVSLRHAVDNRALKHKLARRRRAIQKTPHPGTWRHFVASRARDRDARAVPLLHRKTRRRDRSQQEREL